MLRNVTEGLAMESQSRTEEGCVANGAKNETTASSFLKDGQSETKLSYPARKELGFLCLEMRQINDDRFIFWFIFIIIITIYLFIFRFYLQERE